MMFQLFFLFHLLSVDGNIFDEAVQKELKQIQSYDLVYFDVQSTPPMITIEFDAFNQHYVVELNQDAHLTPSNIRHTNGNLAVKYGLKQVYTHLNESCHYSGKVLNTDGPSIASISMCPGSGVTGRIHAFGDKLMIRPSKYYFDREYDRLNLHNISDEHLVYKLSNDGRGTHDINENRHPNTKATDANTRRRLASDDVIVRVYAMPEETFVAKFKAGYPSMWYDKVVQYLLDILSGTAAIYNENDWGIVGIGTFKFVLAEVNVVERNIGDYARLKATKGDEGWWLLEPVHAAFGLLDDEGVISIDWSGEDGTKGRIDQATIFVYLYESDDTGYANINAFCNSWNGARATMSDCYSLARTQTVYAHELGHNFGMQHDSNGNDCVDKPMVSVMAAGGVGGDIWSSCSKDYMLAEFARLDEKGCLRSAGDGEIKSNIKEPLNPTVHEIDDPPQCLMISNHKLLYNGAWRAAGTYDGKAVYIKDGLYLHYSGGHWVIFNSLSVDDDPHGLRWWDGSCQKDDIRDCDGNWNSENYPDSKFKLTDCSGLTVEPPTKPPTAITSQCIRVGSFNSNVDGEYQAESRFNSQLAYKKDNLWLLTAKDSGGGLYWAMHTELIDGAGSDDDPVWRNGWCGQTNIENCGGGKWENNNDATDATFAKIACGITTTTTTTTSSAPAPTSTTTTTTTTTKPPATTTSTTATTTTTTTKTSTTDQDDGTTECIKVTNSARYSGNWIEVATFNSNPAYKKGSLWMLRALDAWDGYYWAIYTELKDGAGSDDDPVWNNGWCGNTDLERCTGNWDNNNDANGATFTKSKCSRNTGADDGGLSCVRISGLREEWDGEWPKIESQVYQKKTEYLRYTQVDGGWYWIISQSQTRPDLSNYCTKPNILDCSGQWYTTTKGAVGRDDNCVFSECSGAFEEVVPDCVTNNEYKSNLCVYNNNSALDTGEYEMDFEVYNECSNEKPMYRYTQGEVTYFIWYREYERFGENFQEWLMSEDSATTNAIAYCRESDLLNCIDGEWIMKQTNGDTSQWITIEKMSILNRACVVTDAASPDSAKGANNIAVIIMVVLAVLFVGGVVALICVCYVLPKRTKKGKVVQDFEEDCDDEIVIDDADTLPTENY